MLVANGPCHLLSISLIPCHSLNSFTTSSRGVSIGQTAFVRSWWNYFLSERSSRVGVRAPSVVSCACDGRCHLFHKTGPFFSCVRCYSGSVAERERNFGAVQLPKDMAFPFALSTNHSFVTSCTNRSLVRTHKWSLFLFSIFSFRGGLAWGDSGHEFRLGDRTRKPKLGKTWTCEKESRVGALAWAWVEPLLWARWRPMMRVNAMEVEYASSNSGVVRRQR